MKRHNTRPSFLAAALSAMLLAAGALVLACDMPKPANTRKPVPVDTPLHTAVQSCDVDRVKWVIEQGADIEAKGTNRDTPLHRAAKYCHAEMVKLLLKTGANPKVEGLWRAFFGELAERRYIPGLGTAAPAYNIFDIDKTERAREEETVKVLQVLLEAGADPNAKIYGLLGRVTPLHRAVNVKIVNVLLEAGANPNAKNERGETPLYRMVAMPGAVKSVKALLKAGANPRARGNAGETPLDIAENKWNNEIVDILRRAGG